MSMESAIKFYETLEKDTDLQKKIGEMKDNTEVEKLVNGVLGYDFSQEEMQKVIFDRNPELSDEELEAVVGGFDLDSALIGASAVFPVAGGAVFIIGAVAAAA